MEKIAIIGLSCLYPGAQNPEEFWHNLIEERDSTSQVTAEEIGLNPEIFYEPGKSKPDKTYCLKKAGIQGFQFDPTGYSLPAELLATLDPICQLTLYTAKQALKDSKYANDRSALSRCGALWGNLSFPTKLSNQIFAPIYQQSVELAVKELLNCDRFQLSSLPTQAKLSLYNAMTSSLPSLLVAQALSLGGISFSLDAACASSLYAVKLASHYLQSGKADLMLAGAISYADPLFIQMLFSGIQALPENGISRPLDKATQGLIPADGMGTLVLKRYRDAVRDGDRIYALVSGCGLSNDGRGKHLLSPNQKGQILAFERAYAEAGISPKDIDYLECHATGTLLGDTTELSSIDAFFGQQQASPLVGSVKSNVGHLLTAAGMVSILKVILSMSEEIIPATINITDPVDSPNKAISAKNIVRNSTPWLNNSSPKRAAISGFGLGGTNAHLILEQAGENAPNLEAQQREQIQPVKIAIVGMDAFFGSCDGLDKFERSIYEGTQHFIPLPAERWKGIEAQEQLLQNYGFENGKAPLGAYIENFTVDPLRFKVPPDEADKINPQQLIMLQVGDRALQDAGMKEGGNVAVIVAMETELSVHQLQQRWNLPWQVAEGLQKTDLSLPSKQISQLETILKDSLHPTATPSAYAAYIGNIVSSRIASCWDFTGPCFTISAGENSTFKALEVAQLLLAANEVDAVVVGAVDLAGGLESVLLRHQLAPINTNTNTLSYDQKANGWIIGEGAGAVVLKRLDRAQQDGNRIYAAIDAVSLVQSSERGIDFPPPPAQEAIAQACQQAFQSTGCQPKDIAYLEVFGSGVQSQDESEIKGLLQAYQTVDKELNCAIGSVKANIGHTYAASGMASLIKTALCLYHRYFPAVPQWSAPKMAEIWQGSPFYVPTDSRPWFLGKGAEKRVAAINGMGIDGTFAHLIISEEPTQQERSSNYLAQMPFYIFPIAADDRSTLLEQLNALEETIKNSPSLSLAASQTFAAREKHSQATYALAILGHNKDELIQQIQRAISGVANAFESGEDWQTPIGSYFTPKPLGKTGKIGFVYPGLFAAYLGIGREIYRLFPKIYQDLAIQSPESPVVDLDRLINPRSLSRLSKRQLEQLEKELIGDGSAMAHYGIGYGRLMTVILRDYFHLKPHCTFGYSYGEITTFCSHDVWENFLQATHSLKESPLFRNRVSGAQNAVREYWGLPPAESDPKKAIWSAHALIAPSEQVRERVKSEQRVFLTHINTPNEVVIAGDPQACRNVIEDLKCDAFRAPFDQVLHCEPMGSEFNEIAKICTLPIQRIPDTVFYSASECQPIALDSHSIGRSIARGLCEQLNFPRLIDRLYSDDVKIFIEVGAGSSCCRWIGEILKQKEYLTVPLNQRGISEHKSIVRALAKLHSHRVPLDLSPLYSQLKDSAGDRQSLARTVTLGGTRIESAILSDRNRELFQKLPSNDLELPVPPVLENPAPEESKVVQEIIADNFVSETSPSQLNGDRETDNGFNIPEQLPAAASNDTTQLPISDLPDPQYENLSENNSRLTKAHSTFLQARQEALQQMSELIQLQIAIAQKLFEP